MLPIRAAGQTGLTMTASELPPNMQAFNEITAVIFSQLYRTFPTPRTMDPDFAAHMLGLPGRRHLMEYDSLSPFEKSFIHALQWLVDAGFVRCNGHLVLDGVVLTTKGLAAMNVVLPSLSRPLGAELAEAAGQASTEGGKTRISQMMGDFWGSFIGSLTKSMGSG